MVSVESIGFCSKCQQNFDTLDAVHLTAKMTTCTLTMYNDGSLSIGNCMKVTSDIRTGVRGGYS